MPSFIEVNGTKNRKYIINIDLIESIEEVDIEEGESGYSEVLLGAKVQISIKDTPQYAYYSTDNIDEIASKLIAANCRIVR